MKGSLDLEKESYGFFMVGCNIQYNLYNQIASRSKTMDPINEVLYDYVNCTGKLRNTVLFKKNSN